MTAAPVHAQDASLPPQGRIALSAVHDPDPHEALLTLHGTLAVQDTVLDLCRGFVGEAPDLVLDYRAQGFDLFISARPDNLSGEEGVSLAIQGPGGDWRCSGLRWGSLRDFPEIRFEDPVSGPYRIWIGRAKMEAPQSARLFISRFGFGAEPDRVSGGLGYIDISSIDAIALGYDFSPNPHEETRTARGHIDGRAALGEDCGGYFDSRAVLALNYFAAGGVEELVLSADSEHGPVALAFQRWGEWGCDAGGAEGRPEIVLGLPEPWTVRSILVWAGVHERGAEYPAVIRLTRRPASE
ncbi:MAG: hypothetical protein KIS81_11285 [Maricaulaceae bacterium]|nr:hypothetical protein [Maricaulaceae bacterium]